MTTTRALLAPAAVLAVLLLAPDARAEGSTPALPETIHLKTSALTFNNHYDFALVDGRIWFKPRKKLESAAWKLLGPQGLPFGDGSGDPPARLREIDADATTLVAIGEDGRIYDAELGDVEAGQLKWNFLWGWPLRLLPDKVFLPKGIRGWAYSLTNQEVYWSEDIDGNPHTVLRCDTLYALASDGRSIRYDDPWLPPNAFDFKFSTPNRGAFAAIAIAASGSTVMVMDRAGNLFTRLLDFDTMGGNPGIAYSYERRRLGFAADDAFSQTRAAWPFLLDVRTLPPEDWRAQPRIEGKITSRLTVLQTGKGNAARELRVQGADASGATGYFSKPIYGPAWTFVKTGEPISAPWIDPAAAPEPGGSPDQKLQGVAHLYLPAHARQDVRAELHGFNTLHNPMTVRLFPEGAAPVEMVLHTRPDVFPPSEARANNYLGVLQIPAAQAGGEDSLRTLDSWLGHRDLIDVHTTIEPGKVQIRSNGFAQATDLAFRLSFERTAVLP